MDREKETRINFTDTVSDTLERVIPIAKVRRPSLYIRVLNQRLKRCGAVHKREGTYVKSV